MIKVMVSAGEVSGDLHASFLTSELLRLNPTLKIFGMAGERSKAAGVDVRIDLSAKGTVGITEVLRFLPSILTAYFKMKALLKKERPDLLVLVDYQGFNMLLAKYAKKIGIKTIYYISPQEWLWGAEKGVKAAASSLYKILAIFEDEAKAYKKAGANVVYIGNPNLDTIKLSADKASFCRSFGLNPNFPVLGLFPGSRLQEINRLLGILLKAGNLIKARVPNAQFVLSLSSEHFRNGIEKKINGSRVKLIYGKSHDILNASNVSLAASGTVTMEATILGAPIIMAYKISLISYLIGKYILRIRLPYFSMTNLIAGYEVIPEFVQDKATAENIAGKAIELLTDKGSIAAIKAGYSKVLSKFGSPGAVKRAAQQINYELRGKI
ncbi:MAG: lipid-A-disaccharide synthase [Candidatus Margulisiibacteriota bacterium]